MLHGQCFLETESIFPAFIWLGLPGSNETLLLALQALRGGLGLEMFSPELDPKGMFKPRWRVRLRANVGQEVTDQILESKN